MSATEARAEVMPKIEKPRKKQSSTAKLGPLAAQVIYCIRLYVHPLDAVVVTVDWA